MSDIWSDALQGVRPRVGQQTFEMWLQPVRLQEVDGDVLRLSAPNRFLKDWFETHYLDSVLEQLQENTERDFRVAIEVDADDAQTRAPETVTSTAHSPAPVAVSAPAIAPAATDANPPVTPQSPRGLHPRYRFDNFITGGSNELAASAARAVADDPGRRFNPLFIYGGVGLGKTHLLHAVGHELFASDPRRRIVYLSAEQFMNEFVTAVRQNRFDEFRQRYRRNCDCLLIDDIQFISGRDKTMDEFFHVFNALYESGKQIVVTADRVPADMQGMEERLISRLNWGLVADVQAPDLETRMAILEQKAERDNIPIEREVVLLLAELVRSNVRELEGALLRVSAFASLKGVPINEDFVREVLGKARAEEAPQVTVEAVQKAVAGYYSVRIADLKGRRRHRGISRPRMVAMYLCRELTGASFPEIGMRFGGKDHSTVINACRRIKALQDEEPEIYAAVERLRKQLSHPQ